MEYRAIKRVTRPDSFATCEDSWFYSNKAFVFLGRHRDSDILTESNFECGLAALGGESDTVKIVRESHQVVSWLEWIAIHESDAKALKIADEIMCALSDDPVVNEEDWSEREWNAAKDYWESLDMSEWNNPHDNAVVSGHATVHGKAYIYDYTKVKQGSYISYEGE